MSTTIDQTEKELRRNLAWDLNKLLQHNYKELYSRMGLEDLEAKAHAEHPGKEVAELLFYIYKRNGRKGLKEFYDLIVRLEENKSVDLINKSSAHVLFTEEDDLQVVIEKKKPVIDHSMDIKVDSGRTLNDIKEIKRYSIADAIVEFTNWDRLGLAFEDELKTTFTKNALKAQKGNHSTDKELAEHLISIFAQRLLPVSAFKRELENLGMGSVVKKFAEELK